MGLSHVQIEARNRQAFQRERIAASMRVRLEAERKAFGARLTQSVVLAAVAVVFEIDADVLVGPSRNAAVVRARFALFWLSRLRLKLTFCQIGRRFGRDHTTILHAVRRAEALRVLSPDFAERLARAECDLWPSTRPGAPSPSTIN